MKIESPGPVVQTSSFQPEQAIEVQLHTEIFLQTQSFTDSSDNFHEMVRWNTLEHCCLKTHHVAARCQGGLLGIAAAVKQEKLRKSWARFYSGRSTIFTAFTATLRALEWKPSQSAKTGPFLRETTAVWWCMMHRARIKSFWPRTLGDEFSWAVRTSILNSEVTN